MSRVTLPGLMVGNEFIVPQPEPAAASPIVHPPVKVPTGPVLNDMVYVFERSPKDNNPFKKLLEWVHRYSFVAFAFLFLLVIGAAVEVGAIYWSAHITLRETAQKNALHIPAQPIHGPNTIVSNRELGHFMQKVAGQPLNLTIGSQSLPVSGDTIRGWLQVATVKSKGVSYIHVNEPAVAKTIQDLAKPYVKAPVNQVTVTHADGTIYTIARGQAGTTVGDTSKIATQIANSVLAGKGIELKLPVTSKAFASVTAANFNKLIEVNVITKQMYLYDKGKLTRSYPISAGAPATPTPIGQFQIYEKLAVQDMRGYNTDGTKYFQPHVHWINYFLPGGYAVHGNYWRPLSWFGAINSSHGCVSLPDYEAEWVYDWAPLGTTVITHY